MKCIIITFLLIVFCSNAHSQFTDCVEFDFSYKISQFSVLSDTSLTQVDFYSTDDKLMLTQRYDFTELYIYEEESLVEVIRTYRNSVSHRNTYHYFPFRLNSWFLEDSTPVLKIEQVFMDSARHIIDFETTSQVNENDTILLSIVRYEYDSNGREITVTERDGKGKLVQRYDIDHQEHNDSMTVERVYFAGKNYNGYFDVINNKTSNIETKISYNSDKQIEKKMIKYFDNDGNITREERFGISDKPYSIIVYIKTSSNSIE